MDRILKSVLLVAALTMVIAGQSAAQRTRDTVEFPGSGDIAFLRFLFLPESPIQVKNAVRMDILALALSYPGYCRGLEVNGPGAVFVVLSDGTRIRYDDGVSKGFEERRNNPDLEDTLVQDYPLGRVSLPVPENQDPGRFRVEGLFKAVYGDTEVKVRANLVDVHFCGTKVLFNSQNGAARALEKVGEELAGLIKRKPTLSPFVMPLGGTFNGRQIAGTERVSPHAFGIAIDLNPKKGAYWRWEKEFPTQSVSAGDYPWEIVEAFERQGFIWGGKWYHFDLMHFEYRPELLTKSRIERAKIFVD